METRDNEKTKVIFRIFPDGDVVAQFPEIPGDNDMQSCMSYMFIGQHGASDVDLSHITRIATKEEYKDLKDHLEQDKGYRLEVVYRVSPAMNKNRILEVLRQRQELN